MPPTVHQNLPEASWWATSRATDPRSSGTWFQRLEALHRYCQLHYGLNIVAHRVCQHHQAPFEYVAWSFLDGTQDALVWANRGGAKTELGAITSHLDAVFRPGCQIRVIGGSAEQSQKMYQSLLAKWHRGYWPLLAGKPTAHHTRLLNGSSIEALTQSPKAVRGMRVQKLKCDELDEFDPEVWSAIQFTTMSRPGIPATLEAFSTMHKPAGLMFDYVQEAQARGIRTFKWCILETMQQCQENCSRCPMHGWCGGRAKASRGYIAYSDVLSMFLRSTNEAWQAEMLCERPNLSGLVYKEFDLGRNVIPYERPRVGSRIWGCLDFGYGHPFACLLVSRDQAGSEARLVVHAEYYSQGGHSYDEHAAAIKMLFQQHCPGRWPDHIWADTEHQGNHELRRHGIPSLGASMTKSVGVVKGIEVIRELLMRSPETGRPTLLVCANCRNLISEFLRYSWSDGAKDQPEKEYDHALDALRYGIVSECADLSQRLTQADKARLKLQMRDANGDYRTAAQRATKFGNLDKWRRELGIAKLPKPDRLD